MSKTPMRQVMVTSYIVVSGNPINGFFYFGPFIDADAALAWAKDAVGEAWWVTKLEGPVRFVPDDGLAGGSDTSH